MPRVTAKFQFNLPFEIRMLGENACKPATFEIGEDRVVVYPPARWNEQDRVHCWTSDPGHLVGSIGAIPIWLADEVLIDVEREIQSDTITQKDADIFLDIARDFLTRLLQTCRWRTGQTWVHPADWSGSYSVRYFDEAGNRITGGTADVGGVVKVIVVTGLPHLDSTAWDTICRDIASGSAPELWEELLLDAKEALPRQPRRAVIDAGAACEMFIESFCNKLADSLAVDKEVYGELALDKRAFPEWFHVVLRYLVKRSLKDEHSDIYDEMWRLYKTANSVRHEGRCQYKEKGIVEVDAPRASKMINAARSAIEWANSLRSAP